MSGSTIDSLMKAASGVLPASPLIAVSRLGPTVPVAPAWERVWQLAQPAEVKTALPAVASPVAPPDVGVEEPPLVGVLDPPVDGVDTLGETVETGRLPSPTLEAPLVSVPERAITTTITMMPMMVPRSAAVRTLIICAAHFTSLLRTGGRFCDYPKKGMFDAPSKDDVVNRMLDRRDIQTLMYCVRLTEIAGQWQAGYPVRSPHDLECKLAELLREVESQQQPTKAA